MIRFVTRRSTVFAAATLIAVGACANELVAPETQSKSASIGSALHRSPRRELEDGPGMSADHRATPVKCAPTRSASWRGTFGPGGGTLFFGNSRLIIPGGALRTTVTITATQVGDGTSRVDFQPQGLRFAKPAGLVLDGSDCALPQEGSASIVYLNDEGEVLETIPARYDPHWKSVAAPIEHFSGYAIAF